VRYDVGGGSGDVAWRAAERGYVLACARPSTPSLLGCRPRHTAPGPCTPPPRCTRLPLSVIGIVFLNPTAPRPPRQRRPHSRPVRTDCALTSPLFLLCRALRGPPHTACCSRPSRSSCAPRAFSSALSWTTGVPSPWPGNPLPFSPAS